jgi:N-acyl-D-aspartate/D-glutamate deacylase
MRADVIVFDPERIIDRAEFGKPHQYAEGVIYVLVNGVVVLDDGKMSGERPGQLLFGSGRVPQ